MKENQFVIEINPLLKMHLHLKPGKNLKWNWNGKTENWIVYTDEWNRITIWCEELKVLLVSKTMVLFSGLIFWRQEGVILYQFI